jgi:hypothetical protein
MAADDLRGVIDQMKLMQISIESLNPDPAQTIPKRGRRSRARPAGL